MIRSSRSDPYECITALAWVNNREVKAAAPRCVSFNVVDTNNRLSVQMVWIIGPWSLHRSLQDRSRSRLIFVIKFAVAYHHWADGEACPDGLRTSRWSWASDITKSSMWHTDLTLPCCFSTHARIQNKPIICHNAIARRRFMRSFNLSSRFEYKLMCLPHAVVMLSDRR
jgi:hypothetical protein